MSSKTLIIDSEQVELLGDTGLGLVELARCGRVSQEWIATHVEAGVLEPMAGGARRQWRFSAATLRRVRRIEQLERIYDADPQLAALAADLMEEVVRLRRRLRQDEPA